MKWLKTKILVWLGVDSDLRAIRGTLCNHNERIHQLDKPIGLPIGTKVYLASDDTKSARFRLAQENATLRDRVEKLEACMKHVANSAAVEVDYRGAPSSLLVQTLVDLKRGVNKLLTEALEDV